MKLRTLIAIPVFNEERYVRRVLTRVLEHAGRVLVVDDGSTDDTPSIVAQFPVDSIRHCVNKGYGRSLIDAFAFAHREGYEWLITMDCDEQHEPDAIPLFLAHAARDDSDIISGSRYLVPTPADDAPPADRQAINRTITAEINASLSLHITDSFCGFKAHRVASLARMALTETGYAFPMQFWAQVASLGLRVSEIPVKLIYNDPNRTFGGELDDPGRRLAHYRAVLHSELHRLGAQASDACGDAPMVTLPRCDRQYSRP
jgi:dolichol-phosphate mannosyltransferase